VWYGSISDGLSYLEGVPYWSSWKLEASKPFHIIQAGFFSIDTPTNFGVWLRYRRTAFEALQAWSYFARYLLLIEIKAKERRHTRKAEQNCHDSNVDF
jgi:hypothetical protein